MSGAGCTFVNGEYLLSGPLTVADFARSKRVVHYVRKIPDSSPEKDGGGKTFTIFLCTMSSGDKWWFLSEADEDQPGTDRDIDYYCHKSKAHEGSEPPRVGWITCKKSGIDPPPMIHPFGFMVPSFDRNTCTNEIGKELESIKDEITEWEKHYNQHNEQLKTVQAKILDAENLEIDVLQSRLDQLSRGKPLAKHDCVVCWERPREIVFQCGHQWCSTCAQSISNCPYCRKRIMQRIKLNGE